MSFLKHCFLVGFLVLQTSYLAAQTPIAQFSFTGAAGNEASFAPDAQPANGTLSNMSRGPGNTASSFGGAFSATNFPTGAINLTNYFSFTIQAQTGNFLTLTRIDLDETRSLTGIRDWEVRSSLDGFAAAIATFNVPDNSSTRTQTITLSGSFANLPASTAVEFRLYGFTAEASGGTWRIDNVRLFGAIGPPDLTPPTALSVTPIAANQLQVLFSEAVSLATAQNTANYSLSGLGNPAAAVRDGGNPALVTLTLPSAMTDLQAYTLTVQNVQDLAGNVMSTQNLNFTYFAPFSPASRQVVINEIMADPTNANGVVGLPDAEYVELYNTTNRPINLNGWTLEGTGTATFPNVVIAPNGFVLVCLQADVSKLTPFGTVISWGTSGTLTNTGEELILRDNTNAVIDRFTYNDDMYRDARKKDGGWSLEQINPLLSCSSATNWTASNNPLGGTPNAANSVLSTQPDQTSPALLRIEVLSANRLLVSFNEPMDFASLGNAANYALSGSIALSAATAQTSQLGVELQLASNLVAGVVYTLTINNLRDCSGNALRANTTAQTGLGVLPRFNEVVISEIFSDESPRIALPEAEFIELYNRTGQVIDLERCVMNDGSNKTLGKEILLPGEYAVVCAASNSVLFQGYGKVISVSSLSLTNSGERVTLQNRNGGLVFSVTYSDTWYKNATKREGGWSLEMIDVNNPCGEIDNWAASTDPAGGTPAKRNSVAATRADLTAPLLQRVVALSTDTLQVFFSEKMDSASLANARYTLDPALVVQSVTVEMPDLKSVRLRLTTPIQPQVRYTLRVANATDCSGNLIDAQSSALFGLPQQASSGDIVLNEVLFRPNTGGVRFIELYNNSDKFINLRDWRMQRNRNGSLTSQVITTDNYVMAPQQYVTLTENGGNIKSNYPAAKEETFLTTSVIAFTDKDSVLIFNNAGQQMELFYYLDDYHFPLIDNNGQGVSLERISFTAPTNNRNSWQSAATRVSFATPGYANSQARGDAQSNTRIKIDPQVFTPDGDGIADFTTINYQLEQGGQLGNIWVYDDRGRMIKQLARNELLALQGFYTWDGTGDGGQLVPIGTYILVFEIFDLGGRKITDRGIVVVGARF